MIQAKIPNLSKLDDISQYVLGEAGADSASDSEVDDETSHVRMPQSFGGRGNVKAEKRYLLHCNSIFVPQHFLVFVFVVVVVVVVVVVAN